MEKRTCKKCGVEKSLEEFPKFYNQYSGGYRHYCKVCKKHEDASSKRNRPPPSPEVRKQRLHDRKYKRLKQEFGITPEQYFHHLELQGGVCAICKKTCLTGRKLAVDHDHDTKEIRGLLCCNCNHGIGKFQDNSELLRGAAMYLESTTYRIERTY